MTYSLLDEKDPAAVAAEVVMLRSAANKAALIVEGASDVKLFAAFVADEHCDIVIGWGRENTLDAIAILNEKHIPGVLCVVDRDYDAFLGEDKSADNIIVTDDHDLEMLMFKSRALDKVVRELGSPDKIKRQRDEGVDLREKVISASHPLGVARLYSIKRNLALKFEGFKFRYINLKLVFTPADMFQEIANHSRKHNVSVEDFKAELDYWKRTDHDRALMCCGHDVAVMLGIALQSLWGTRNAKEVDGESIESRLRLAFGNDDFRDTDIYDKIRQWEVANTPYRCLRS